MAHLAQRLAEQGLLRDGMTIETRQPDLAARGFDGFDLLYSGRGMSSDEVVDLFIAMAERRSTPRARAAQACSDDEQRREAAALSALGAMRPARGGRRRDSPGRAAE